jgi:hypothetical protein
LFGAYTITLGGYFMGRFLQISIFIPGLIFLSPTLYGQDIKIIERNLHDAFRKIDYWRNKQYTSDYDSTFSDSLGKANDSFENLLLKYTSNNPQTLECGFESLKESGLLIATSEDGLFKIYSWDTQMGGTMHEFENVFQFRSNNMVISKIIANSKGEEGDPGCFYYQINDIKSDNKTFYITMSRAILSSNNFYNRIKIFSIDNSELNANAKLIKTYNGLSNELGFEVDLTASGNNDGNVPDFSIIYDKVHKSISIPIILSDSKITDKRIIYKFNGKYFERM